MTEQTCNHEYEMESFHEFEYKGSDIQIENIGNFGSAYDALVIMEPYKIRFVESSFERAYIRSIGVIEGFIAGHAYATQEINNEEEQQ